MAKFKKTILVDDRDYHSPDGVLTVDRGQKAHWAKKVQEFTSRNFGIPCFWDHQADPKKAQPVQFDGSKRRRAKGQAGWLVGASLADDGGLELEFDVPGAADAKQVKSNLAKVSPVFWESIKDGRGQTHENIIGACDFVVHPVDDTQTNFEEAGAIACSVVRYSNGDTPQFLRFSEGDDMADENENTDGGNEDSAVTDDNGGRLKKVTEALASMDIVLSDDTNEENFLEHLEQALLTAAAQSGENPGTAGEDNEVEVTAPQFAAMSLERKKEKLYLDKQNRSQLQTRLSAVLESGRCTPAEHKEQSPKLVAVRLSLDDNGDSIPSSLESWIDSREAVPAGTFWTDEQRLRLGPVEAAPHPEETEGALTDEQAEKMVDGLFGKK
jgi:hypothetical protein